MAVIGNLGKTLNFQVSDKHVLTIRGMQKTAAGRWASHARIGKAPRSEFLGPDLGTITFQVTLSAALGVHPSKQLAKIEKAIRKGKAMEFVLGGKKVGDNLWVIQSVSEKWDCIFTKGELAAATVSLTLKEYV